MTGIWSSGFFGLFRSSDSMKKISTGQVAGFRKSLGSFKMETARATLR
jgi:hypothetical protein